jgi:hypothetical protein
MDLFGLIRTIYEKKGLEEEVSTTDIVLLNRWLSFDRWNIGRVRKVMKYLFFVEPIHYFYLLYFNMPQVGRAPFLKSYKKEKDKEDKVFNKIAYTLDWSNKEFELNKNILNKVIDKKYWKKELGVK